jgi:hypothetical protein
MSVTQTCPLCGCGHAVIHSQGGRRNQEKGLPVTSDGTLKALLAAEELVAVLHTTSAYQSRLMQSKVWLSLLSCDDPGQDDPRITADVWHA